VNERGFSRFKNIKSELSTCLGEDLLDWLMLITIEGPALKDRRPYALSVSAQWELAAAQAACPVARQSWRDTQAQGG
jgi:hypothetical protein